MKIFLIGMAIILSLIAAGVGITLFIGCLIDKLSVKYEGPSACFDCNKTTCKGCPLNIGE